MSLVDGDHITGARERHGAHYYTVARKHDGKHVTGMRFRFGEPVAKEPMCNNCFRVPFDPDAKKCIRCGGEIG